MFGQRALLGPRGLLGFVIVGVMSLGVIAAATQPASSAGIGTAASSPAAPQGGSPGARLITWSGIRWYVYPNCDNCGPSLTPTTNAAKAVYVDRRGWLHLKVMKIAGRWRGVELRALGRATYGRYRMVVDTPTPDLDPYAVLGMFVYRPGTAKYTNEIDIEDSRFPHLLPAPENAQFTTQPYFAPGHKHGYAISSSEHPLLQQFTWYPPFSGAGTIDFETRVGSVPRAPLLASWTYRGYSVPTSADMQLFVVLWMNQDKTPTSGKHSAVVRSLDIRPLGG